MAKARNKIWMEDDELEDEDEGTAQIVYWPFYGVYKLSKENREYHVVHATNGDVHDEL
jgi:hypothetical protein